MTAVQQIYNQYLQQLSMIEKLEMLELLVQQTLPKVRKQQVEKKKYNVIDFEGIAKPNYLGEDAQVYVSKLRDKWD